MISRLYNLRSKLFDSLDRRFRRSRPGSVLILVVALLVLLALLGTAYINTAQSDRYSSSQNTFNTEVELLLQGLESITQGTIANNLFETGFHTDTSTSKNTPPDAVPITTDYPANASGAFIADRYPSLFNLGAVPSSNNAPYWRFLTQLPVTNNTFESPYVNGTSYPKNFALDYPQTITKSPRNPLNEPWYPTFVPVPQPNAIAGQPPIPQLFPALANVVAGQTYVYLAADTDGDGIADAGLFRLPVGTINGITYYGAVRVVDNCAAVNAAIAWAPYTDAPGGPIPASIYPTNVDFLNILNTNDGTGALANLNTVRFSATYASLTPVDDRPNAQPAAPPVPPSQLPVVRPDFTFGNQFEAAWMQLGRRLANPGYNASSPTNATGAGLKYTALDISEMQSMARHFILRDPSITNALASSSVLEQKLQNSVFTSAPSAAYLPSDPLTWYQKNFDYVNNPAVMPIRSMLVTQNPVSNFVSSKLYARGSYIAANSYSFGDWVTFTDGRAYVCIQSAPAGTGPDPTNPSGAYWERQPWASGPTKVSANTATFGQLWTGYFQVMSNIVALPAAANTTFSASPEGSANTNSVMGPNTTKVVPTIGNPETKGMFRSSIRNQGNAGTPHWGPAQELQLRAALAAVNTIDLRDSDDDVTSRDIVITGDDQATLFKVTVYGSEGEPYITEIYANDDSSASGPKGDYIAIEIYNPTSKAITLTNWQLATIQRANDGTALTPTAIPSTKTAWASTAPTIPAGGFIVLANSNAPPSSVTMPPTGPVTIVSDLDQAFDNELVLLRPRRADGTLQKVTSPTNTYDETTNVQDLVPVDSYDFTGLPATEMDPGTCWHYIRPNDPGSKQAWHFVYPGGYPDKGSAPLPMTVAKAPRQTATAIDYANVTTDLSSLGKADAALAKPVAGTATTFIDRPLPIASPDMAGPKATSLASGPANAAFPYGGFARNGDLMNVTYVGAYRISGVSAGSPAIIELNAVTMDSAMANDTSMDDILNAEQLGRQNIGRFTPVHWADTVDASGNPPTSEFALAITGPVTLRDDYVPDFVPSTAAPTQPPYWPTKTAYNWTMDLFDYLTVQAPHDDYLPDTDPAKYSAATAVANSTYLVANAGYSTANPSASTNYPTVATEEAAPVHGRININTANWRILATLPFVDGVSFTPNPGNNAALVTEQIAQSIVYYRDIDDGTYGATGVLHPHGPFQSIAELNEVPLIAPSAVPVLPLNIPPPPYASYVEANAPLPVGTLLRTVLGSYQAAGSLFPVSGVHASNSNGELAPYNSASPTSPPTAGPSNVYGDFENQNLALNRISNMITTRSDSFTAYVLVQGWRHAGTDHPELVVQRRGAFIIDRSTITPANNTSSSVTNVPVE
jgi:hypothetical protein